MYNVGAKTLTQAWRTDLFSYGDVMPGGTVFPYVIPRWPTLVLGHKQRDEGSSSCHVAEKVSVSAAAIATSKADQAQAQQGRDLKRLLQMEKVVQRNI
ncbi:hypothetical protein EV1_002358 [Malus domestica]